MLATIANLARVLLGLIRVVNGSIGLFKPVLIIRRFEEGSPGPAVADYALRMFGIRTILIGLDLLRPSGAARARAVHAAPLIHASDSVAAILAARSGLVPRETGRLIVAISATNTVLAILAQASRRG